ncbi:hypothetical protein FKR84_02025 [Haloflavibacter putidus]|uniref:Uncharacterized protein n=1 Tax=Haloflavibacter putidus TaxID=2576776 RepID=A0A507ZW57_9FLAO|nr:hypothetical protein FKR84_02025 [Haloflavibacter putidus]
MDKQKIKFIDNYLTKSGVDFLDIRMEMLDHVASAVEEKMQKENLDFYDAFKSYMLKNKNELLKTSGKYRWSLDKKLLLLIGKNLFLAKSLLLLFALGAIKYFSTVQNISWLYSVLVLSPLFYLGVPAVIYRKFKFSFTQRLGLFSVIVNYFTYFIFIDSLGGETTNFYVLLAIFWINISIAFTAYKTIKTYYKQAALA